MTSVHATGAGIVRIAGGPGGYGNLVEIEHPGGVRTRYGHLARVLVSPGESVGQGQTIGRMGSTGRSTGTHLHYEVRVNGVAVDPLDYIGQTVPSYQTAWAAETSVSARWAGWSDDFGRAQPSWGEDPLSWRRSRQRKSMQSDTCGCS